jgi:hypothetical protein
LHQLNDTTFECRVEILGLFAHGNLITYVKSIISNPNYLIHSLIRVLFHAIHLIRHLHILSSKIIGEPEFTDFLDGPHVVAPTSIIEIPGSGVRFAGLEQGRGGW